MKYLKLNRFVSIEDIFVGDTNTFVIVSVLFNVKPVFMLENYLYNNTKPERDHFLTHIKLYKTINANVC